MITDKLITRDELPELMKEVLEYGETVVFTNGCFDILHAGHVRYLEKAKAQGDLLIVGLNSDASVHRLKGEGRPINVETNRAIVLAGLEAVDYVVIFDEDTPYNLIKAIQPDVLVKGGDWKEDSIVGADIVKAKGGRVKSLPFWEGLSTTKTIESMNRK